jgi:multimeric flavodoxin WrbA
MRITVLGGSPKGDKSVTLQYVRYVSKAFPQHEFNVIHAAQGVRKMERDEGRFEEVIGQVRESDGVLWAFPLYILAVHADYMRFIELIGERGAESAFRGKWAAALSTSIHFFDNTAHSYMRAVCDDLGMKYAGFFSASMDDLMHPEFREKLKCFTAGFLRHIEENPPSQRLYAPVREEIPAYMPGPAGAPADNAGLRTLLITDGDECGNLGKMTDRLLAAFSSPVEAVNLRTANIKGGCLGCLKCGFDNECAYDGSDDIREIYDEKIKNADIVIFAAALRGRFLSSRFKTFVDRRFLHTHQPQMEGKQVAYVVSGPLGRNANVLEIVQGITELDRANLSGVVTDECGDSGQIDALIDNLAGDLVKNARAKYVQPQTFLGVGGMKIFRDDIYGHLRFVFQADHRYYKKHGVYDFPQKDIKMRLTNAVMVMLTKIPKIKEQIRGDLIRHMVEPFKKVNG